MKITYIKTGKKVRDRDDSKLQNIYDDFKIKNRQDTRQPSTIKDFRNISNKENRKVVKKELINNTNKSNEKKNKFKGIEAMQTILKKNQLVIVSLALMLITAGYMNYNNNADEINMSLAELGDAKLVGTNVYSEEKNQQTDVPTNDIDDNESKILDTNVVNEVTSETSNPIDNLNNNEIESTNNETTNSIDTANQNINSKDYFVQTRLDRDTMYSQMLETYQKILENENVPSDQKGIASNEIKNINDRKAAISIAENLIKTKGFEDVAILINDNSINVVVKQKDNLKEEQTAQITNIISRELKAEIADIHISVHK